MVERKYMAHYIDASFGGTETNYVRLGKDLEEYTENLNPQVEAKRNILGENSVHVYGFQPQSEVTPFYYDYDDALSEKIVDIINGRKTGDNLRTTMVDALLKPGTTDADPPTVVWAFREDCVVVPSSGPGGNTTGVQTPFTIYKAGNRVKGTFNLTTKAFTEQTDQG